MTIHNDEPDEAPDTSGDGTVTVTVTPPDEDGNGATDTAALDAIQARIEAVETRITDELESNRQCQTETITSLRQDITNLQLNLSEVVQGMPSQIASLQEQLTQLSQELQRVQNSEPPLETVAVVIPPEEPDLRSADGTPTDANAPDASQSAPKTRKGKRVI